jgi:curved DNA-binding protein CbpA
MRGSAYKLFGLSPGASEEEIRKRYRELVKKFHPDVNKDANAEKKFIEIQTAYEELMREPEAQLGIDHPTESTFQEEYTSYREHARQQFQARKKKEAEELEKLYVRLQTGPIHLLHRCIALASLIVLLTLCLDLILPNQRVSAVITSYSTDVYHSMNGNLVSLAKTNQGESFFLNAFSNRFFDTNPFIEIKKTAIFHQSVSVLSHSKESLQEIPIHFSFYWAQFLLFPFFLIPIAFLIYRKKDAFFIMGSYFTRYASGIILLYFLISQERWYHLLTLGFS